MMSRKEDPGFLGGFSHGAIMAFALTYAGHTSVHAGRKAFAACHSELEDVWGFSSQFLGALDTAFMISYGIGLLLNGYLAERIDTVVHMGVGVVASAVCLVVLGMSAVIGISSDNYPWYITITVLWAAFQSASIPCGVKIMSGWFNKNRGAVFGLWATNGVVGNLVGLAISAAVASFVENGVVLYMLTIPGLIVGFVGLCQLMILSEGPYSAKADCNTGSPPSISEVLQLPGVSSYAVTYACVKTVDTSIFFWIVFYLNESLHYTESSATLLAMAYDAAQVFGSLLGGHVSDKIGSRPPVFFGMLIAATVCISTITRVSHWPLLLLVIFSIGLTTGGPCMLMHTAVAADVGSKNKAATAVIVGIVDGSGSAAASLGQLAIGYVSASYGWNAVFYMLSALLALASCLTAYIWTNEVQSKRKVKLRDDPPEETATLVRASAKYLGSHSQLSSQQC